MKANHCCRAWGRRTHANNKRWNYDEELNRKWNQPNVHATIHNFTLASVEWIKHNKNRQLIIIIFCSSVHFCIHSFFLFHAMYYLKMPSFNLPALFKHDFFCWFVSGSFCTNLTKHISGMFHHTWTLLAWTKINKTFSFSFICVQSFIQIGFLLSNALLELIFLRFVSWTDIYD